MLWNFKQRNDIEMERFNRQEIAKVVSKYIKLSDNMQAIVDDFYNFSGFIQYARGGVRGVTFDVNALIPIVVRIGGVLQFDRFQPRVFPRGLVEVSMHTYITFHHEW
jgi:hypothetical protein